jgi:hypothetical protein
LGPAITLMGESGQASVATDATGGEATGWRNELGGGARRRRQEAGSRKDEGGRTSR